MFYFLGMNFQVLMWFHKLNSKEKAWEFAYFLSEAPESNKTQN